MSKNNCYDCKHRKYEMYNHNRCKHPDVMKIITTDGIVHKVHPLCLEIKPKDPKTDCEFFQMSRFFRIRLFISNIRLWWFRKRYPEKLL